MATIAADYALLMNGISFFDVTIGAYDSTFYDNV